jgi:hypothetical protein
MSYTVLYNEKQNIVELRFHDTASLKDHIVSRQKVIELCIEKQTNKILVHLDNLIAQDSISKEEEFEFAESWDENISKELYFAVVMPENVDSQNEFYFIVHMSKIKDITIKTFYNEKLAIKWLTS